MILLIDLDETPMCTASLFLLIPLWDLLLLDIPVSSILLRLYNLEASNLTVFSLGLLAESMTILEDEFKSDFSMSLVMV